MVANANPEDREPPLAKEAPTERRRRRWREPAFVWWIGLAALLGAAWWFQSWRLALLALVVWCPYEFALVPTACRVLTRQGFSCPDPTRGRLFACSSAHQQVKNDGLWQLVGMRNRFRRPSEPDPNRTTGVVVVSPAVRGRLVTSDKVTIALAACGTVVALAGMIYGLR